MNFNNNLSSLLQGFQAPFSGSASEQPTQMSQTGSNAELLQLLRHRQEEQSRAILAQQLAALNGLQQPQLSPSESLALQILKQQQQQKQIQDYSQLQALLSGRPMPSINNLTDFSLAQILQQKQGIRQPESVPPAGLAPASMVNDQAALAAIPADKRKGRSGTFPQKLHQMLSDLERQEGGTEIASFLPHGRAFCIHKPRDFVKHIMPKYFRMSRFSSFQRQLNLYDFQRITEGPDKG